MYEAKRLNERAGVARVAPDVLWHVAEGHAFFAGPLRRNALHRHSVPVYLAGLYGAFRLRIDGDAWLSCTTAAIPAGVAYEFDMGGDPLAVFYLEPNIARVDALASLVRDARDARGALIGRDGEVALLRAIYEDRRSPVTIEPALRDLAGFCSRRSARKLDPRIASAVGLMQKTCGDLAPAAEIAGTVGLSSSRFQHLFTQEVGVPFRRYRAWHRMRGAIREIACGSSLTGGAHAAGFSDQAHFAREFRKTFGAPASSGIQGARRSIG